jgi:hypothetical protein
MVEGAPTVEDLVDLIEGLLAIMNVQLADIDRQEIVLSRFEALGVTALMAGMPMLLRRNASEPGPSAPEAVH